MRPELGILRNALVLLILGSLTLVSGCSHTPERVAGPDITLDGPPPDPVRAHNVPDAVPRAEQPSRYGNPESYEVFGKTYRTLDSSVGFVQKGTASWYGRKFHGRRTSSGEPYDMYAMTAAHKELPIPCYVRVTHLENGRSVVVRVNDRGPFHADRIIDLSYAAASRLGIAETGTGPVEIRALTPGEQIPRLASADREAGAEKGASALSEPLAEANASRVTLQVGAFNDPVNATRLRDRLARKVTRPVEIREHRDSPRYRVEIGPLTADEELMAVRLLLDEMGLGDAVPVLAREL